MQVDFYFSSSLSNCRDAGHYECHPVFLFTDVCMMLQSLAEKHSLINTYLQLVYKQTKTKKWNSESKTFLSYSVDCIAFAIPFCILVKQRDISNSTSDLEFSAWLIK